MQWLCAACHGHKTKAEATSRAKANRVQDKHFNFTPRKRKPWKPTRPWVRHVEDDLVEAENGNGGELLDSVGGGHYRLAYSYPMKRS